MSGHLKTYPPQDTAPRHQIISGMAYRRFSVGQTGKDVCLLARMGSPKGISARNDSAQCRLLRFHNGTFLSWSTRLILRAYDS
jgi:hypothetical protein